MKWRRAAVLPLIFALAACAEGGGRGTGIFTTVAGNVASVQTAGPGGPAATSSGAPDLRAALGALLHLGIEDVASAQNELEGIEVSIENTDIWVKTDADGNFTMHGTFEGDITVIFDIPGGGSGRIGLNVPAAGTLTLNNVHIDTQRGEAVAETQAVNFEAIIT